MSNQHTEPTKDLRASLESLNNNNYTINIIHNNFNINVSDIDLRLSAAAAVTSTNGVHNTSVSWCHDLQGSDFIYTPTLYSPTIRHVIAVAFILVMIITVIGNAIVIIIVLTDRPLRRITSALVVSMAAADILVAMCGELQSIIMMLSTEAWALSDVLCEVFTSADLYFSLSGLLHIVFLAGDRFFTICYPFKYERWGHRYLVASIAMSWTLPIAFSFLPIMANWHRIGLEELYACLHDLEVHVCTLFPNKAFSTVSFILMFALPSALMCYCYMRIYKVVQSQRKRMSSVTLGNYSDADVACIELAPMENGNAQVGNGDGGGQGSPKSPTSSSEDSVFIQVRFKPEFTLDLDTNGNAPPATLPTDSLRPKRHGHWRRRSTSTRINPRLSFLGEDFKAARSISLVFLCFALTWMPYWITILVMPYLGPNEIPDPLIGACLWLAYFGSALNPFVYYFSNNTVKRGIRNMFHKLLHRCGHHNHTRAKHNYPSSLRR